MDLHATGVIKHLGKRWFNEPLSTAYDSNNVYPFELSNTVMVFVFLGTGMLAACIIFIGETIAYFKNKE